MTEESVLNFDPLVKSEEEEEAAIKQAESETSGLSKGEGILKFLRIARGCEVLTNRAKRAAGGSSKGKAYNKQLNQEKAAHPDLAEQMKGPQFSAAVWLLKNWDIVRPYLKEMRPSRLAHINANSLRSSIKKKQCGDAKPKKPGLREEVARLRAENDELRQEVEDLRKKLETRLPETEGLAQQEDVEAALLQPRDSTPTCLTQS